MEIETTIKTEQMRQKTVLTNIMQMFVYRKTLDSKWTDLEIEKHIDKLTENGQNETEFLLYNDKDHKIRVIFIFGGDSSLSIGKDNELKDFISQYEKDYKIVVVKSISDRIKQSILATSKNLEIFTENFFLENISRHDYAALHEILSQQEAKKIQEDYDLREKEIPGIYSSDPFAKFLNMQPGQIVKITRKSEYAGYNIVYRKCRNVS